MAYLEKMQQMFSEGKHKELKDFCKTEISLHPNDPDLLFYYASALEALGEYASAKNAFVKLFNVTKDRLFLICGSIPDFAGGKREDAIAALDGVIDEETDPDKLFYAFKIAVNNGEAETARSALYECFRLDPKKTIKNLEEFFEGIKDASADMRIFFVNILNLLRELEK